MMGRKLYVVFVYPWREFWVTLRECYWWSKGYRK